MRISISALPGTGISWMMRESIKTGLDLHYVGYDKIEQDDRGADDFIVSVVRHPYDWLEYFFDYYPNDLHPPIPHLSSLSIIAKKHKSFEEFASDLISNEPGIIARCFDVYEPHSWIKFEDIPWCLYEFLGSVGIEATPDPTRLPLEYRMHPKRPFNKQLRMQFIKLEREFCERFEYYR